MPATRLRGGGCAPSKPDGPPSLDAINRGLPQKPQEQSMSEAVLGQTIAASAPVAVASIVLETSKDAPAPAPPPSVVVPDDFGRVKIVEHGETHASYALKVQTKEMLLQCDQVDHVNSEV